MLNPADTQELSVPSLEQCPLHLRGALRRGRIGTLPFWRVSLEEGLFRLRPQPGMQYANHVLSIQLSGTSRLRCGQERAVVSHGDVVLQRQCDDFQVEHCGPVEKVLLFNVFDPAALSEIEPGRLVVRRVREQLGELTLQWIRDATTERLDWPQGRTSEHVAIALKSMLYRVMQGPTSGKREPQRKRIDRAQLISMIEEQLTSADFSIESLAQSLNCSERTLYRVFAEGGQDESLSRYLQRRRLEACAAAMRHDPTVAQSKVLELALRSGFSSHSHFSTAFRRRFGLTPSDYRRLLQSPGEQDEDDLRLKGLPS